MTKNIKKNQHLVSQMIQRRFSHDGTKVFGIKELRLKVEPFIKYEVKEFSIKNTMCKDFCYEFPKELSFEPNLLENAFAKRESEYSTIVNKIINLIETRNSFGKLKEYIFKEAMQYFLWFYYRTYQHILLGNDNDDNKHLETFIRTLNSLFDKNYLERLGMTIENYYDLHILESNNEEFLLSDSFLSTASIDFKGMGNESPYLLNRNIGLKNIIILIPLTARYYLLFTDDKSYKSHYIKVYKNDILKFNSIIFRNSFEFTIGKNKEMVNFINENVHKYFIWQDITGGCLYKPEIWLNEDFDRRYYLGDFSLMSERKGYCLYGNSQIERSIYPKTNNWGCKMITSNPIYNKKNT